MTFSLSGTTITQSGTDSDLSGLSGITGLEYKEHIAGTNVFRRVEFATGIKLRINGNLTIDASTDQLFFPHTSDTFGWLEVTDGASLTLTDKFEKDGTSQSYQKIAIHSMAQTANHYAAGQGVDIKGGGTLVMDGGGIWTDSHINFWNSETRFIVSSPSLIRLGSATNGSKNILRGGTGGASFDIDGLILLDSTNGFQTGTIAKLDNYSPQFCTEGVMANGELTMYSYEPIGCDIDFSVIAPGSFYVVYGYADKPVTFTLHFDHNNAAGGGWVKIRKKLQITTLDEEGLPIEGVRSYFTDTDHGERQNKIEDLTDTIVYEAISDSNGLAEHDILLANSQLGSYESVGRESAPRPVDYRTKNNSHDYKMDAAVFSYGHHPRIANDIDLTGLAQNVDVALVLSEDSSITEPDQAIVAAYSEITTAPQFYDAGKLWLVNHYSGQSQPLVSIEGGDTILSDYDIVVDATANQAFDFDGSTITIKAHIFEDNLRLENDSTVTIRNGAEVSGTIQDRNGDSVVLITTPAGYDDEVKLYASLADAQSDRTTALISSGDIFRYNASEYGGLSLYVRMETASELFAISSYQVPVESGIYDAMLLTSTTELELANISSKIDSLTIKTRNIEAATL